MSNTSNNNYSEKNFFTKVLSKNILGNWIYTNNVSGGSDLFIKNKSIPSKNLLYR
jgi:hypothetical protein